MQHLQGDNGKVTGVFFSMKEWNKIKTKYNIDEFDDLTLSPEEKKELTNRVDLYLQDPSKVTPWEQVKEEVRNQL